MTKLRSGLPGCTYNLAVAIFTSHLEVQPLARTAHASSRVQRNRSDLAFVRSQPALPVASLTHASARCVQQLTDGDVDAGTCGHTNRVFAVPVEPELHPSGCSRVFNLERITCEYFLILVRFYEKRKNCVRIG